MAEQKIPCGCGCMSLKQKVVKATKEKTKEKKAQKRPLDSRASPARRIPGDLAWLCAFSLLWDVIHHISRVGVGDGRLTSMVRKVLPPARPTLFTGFRMVDREIPALKVFLVKCRNRLVPTARHFHEPEAAQPPGFPVGDQIDAFNRPIGAKKLLNCFRSRTEWEIPDINVSRHTGLLSASPHMACVTC